MDLVNVCGHFWLNVLELQLPYLRIGTGHLGTSISQTLEASQEEENMLVNQSRGCLLITRNLKGRLHLSFSHYLWKLLHATQTATEASRTDVLPTAQKFLSLGILGLEE